MSQVLKEKPADPASAGYHELGAIALAADYMSALAQDAAAALLAGDQANDEQLTAWARIENGSRGYARDLIIDAIARDLNKPSSFVWKALRERAIARAHVAKTGKTLRWQRSSRSRAGARLI